MSILESLATCALMPALLCTVALFALFGIAAAAMMHRFVPRSVLYADNEIKGVVLGVFGVLYAVFVGLVAIGVWDRFEQADVRTYDEAAHLQVLYRDADAFPQGLVIRAALRGYTWSVATYDWERMARGEQAPVTRVKIEKIAALVRVLPAITPDRANVQAEMLAALRTMLTDRDERLSMAATGLNPMLWCVLFIGAIYTVTFACTLGFERAAAGLLAIGSLSVMIGLVLFATLSLDYPFRGSVSITANAFTHAIYNYGLIDRADEKP